MRAVIYARYSSDLQRDASIEDQVRICRARIDREGWDLVGTYTDHATSGASRFRSGYRKLMDDARARLFDIVIAEALDRLSRDQEDVAGLYKHLEFAGVKLITLSEGDITELHVGLKGAMNAIFLKDLAQKIRRGLEGRVRNGKSGGGLEYGYEIIRAFDPSGTPIRGNLTVNGDKAEIVRRIFAAYATGDSPRSIAAALNHERIPGPAGKTWSPSTIYGNWRRGTGILNNELYVGRRVWNRQRFIKDPQTGRRVTRYNPSDELIRQSVPELRIVSDEVWNNVKQRQEQTRSAVSTDLRIRPELARRPAYLFSGLLRCGVCGGGFSKRSETHYACSAAHDRATCNNHLRIRRDVLEASVLSGLKRHMMRPELAREFIAEYNRELAKINAATDRETGRQYEALELIDREIRAIIDAIKAGIRTPTVRSELMALEEAKDRVLKMNKEKADAKPLRLNLAELYRDRVGNLENNLNDDTVRSEAAETLRGLIREIRLVPENDQLEIELIGDLASLLAFSSGSARQRASATPKITLVAGEGLVHYSQTVAIAC